MLFTYDSYKNLLGQVKNFGYQITDYHSWSNYDRCVILRHDIDYDVSKAIAMAELEKQQGVKSTYFVLVTSDLYNVFSLRISDALKKIVGCGHEIGLHFDEVKYSNLVVSEIKGKIIEECEILGKAIGFPVTTVSMHRPSKMILDADLSIPGIINSYGSVFFKGFKYISDSRRRWRESVEDIIRSLGYQRLHILTHPFWYGQEEADIHRSIREFVNHANEERYRTMSENITDIGSIMDLNEVLHE